MLQGISALAPGEPTLPSPLSLKCFFYCIYYFLLGLVFWGVVWFGFLVRFPLSRLPLCFLLSIPYVLTDVLQTLLVDWALVYDGSGRDWPRAALCLFPPNPPLQPSCCQHLAIYTTYTSVYLKACRVTGSVKWINLDWLVYAEAQSRSYQYSSSYQPASRKEAKREVSYCTQVSLKIVEYTDKIKENLYSIFTSLCFYFACFWTFHLH